MALFDEALGVKEKRAIVRNITAGEEDGDGDPPVRVWLPDPLSKTLADFATPNSIKLFNTLDIPTSLLADDPETWKGSQAYEDATKRVRALHVVNDAAERGVALIHKVTEERRTTSEDQVQFLCRVIEENRKLLPSSTKQALMGLE